MDTRELRNCFGKFATGVTVVSWKDDDGNRSGITVNSFTSVSLDPALVLVSIDKRAKALQGLKNRAFIVNILSSTQENIAWQFAGRPQENLMINWEDTLIGPKIADTVATIECLPWKEYDCGDHVLFVGEVKEFSYQNESALIFFSGSFLNTKVNQS